MTPAAFRIAVPDSALADLHARLERTRWPDELTGVDWQYGTPLHVVKSFVERWRTSFDWRAAESTLNRLPQFKMDIDGQTIHFVHVKGASANSAPLLITHGWPGSFVELIKILPLLTHPAENGWPGFPSFDVIIPSLPGFGFSPPAVRPGVSSKTIASLWHALMGTLGYARYFAQGGDIGASVSSWMARLYPGAVRAVHLNFIPASYQPFLGDAARALSDSESDWMARRGRWLETEGAYARLHGTKPQTLGFALTDSPAGLAAWILEKFHAWSDDECGSDLERRFDVDELLTNLSVYWFSGTIAATLRLYKENAAQPLRLEAEERIAPPLSYAQFPKEIVTPPREWVERGYTVARWTIMPRGGHFAALEQPVLLARDIHESFAPFR